MIRTPKKQSSTHRPVSYQERWKGSYGSLGYRSARVAGTEGRSYISYPGSAHDDRDRKKLIAQSRDFMRNNAIYKGMIEQAVLRIVGNGFKLQVAASSKRVAAQVEALWKKWFRRPEIRGLLSGAKTSRMLMREVLATGDTVAIKTDKGLLQLFEAEQLDGDKQHPAGIRKDKYGTPVTFHLCPWKNNAIDVRNGRGVPARDVLFLTNPERPSQTRGVPALQAAFPMLHRINDVCDSEAIAWQMLSRVAIAILRKQGPEVAYDESREDPTKSDDQLEGDMATRMTELDYALIFHGEPGEEVKGIERNIPGGNFSESLRTFLRLLGLPIGLPLELILLDWTRSNYSQSRAVLEQAYENFLQWQTDLEDSFYRPAFEWKLAQWKAANLIGNSKSIESQWIKPTFPWIDQVKEAQAQAAKVERGFITHGQVCKSLNLDREEVIERRAIEVAEAIEKAKQIEEKTGEKVPWQIFAGLEAPGKAAPAPAKDQPDPDEDESEENQDDA
jgi:lambda family phage portal protein